MSEVAIFDRQWSGAYRQGEPMNEERSKRDAIDAALKNYQDCDEYSFEAGWGAHADHAAASRWVSIAENGLPEMGQRVTTVSDRVGSSPAELLYENTVWGEEDARYAKLNSIIAWMPIPPYTKENK